MPYITTKLQPLKSYPTYQLHAEADSKALGNDDVFKICILETFKWLRSRLKDFSDLPKEIQAPEPEDYSTYSIESLMSFSYSNGLSVDVVYIENKGIWSFKLSETDMGANKGADNERQPVNGRTFNTEISFIQQKEFVEIGIRTIVSEPSNIENDCEVFRPTLVKALSENKDIRFSHNDFTINGKSFVVDSKNSADRLFNFFDEEFFNFPIVIVADTKTEIKTVKLPDFTEQSKNLNINGAFSFKQNINVDVNMGDFNKTKKSLNKPVKKEKVKAVASKSEPEKIKLGAFDYNEIARFSMGFAMTVFVDEKYFEQIRNKSNLDIDYGDIIIVKNKNIIEKFRYKDFKDNQENLLHQIKNNVIDFPKRKHYDFGNVLFHSDAKLEDLRTKRHETNSLEEQCNFYRMENSELKSQIKEFSQHQTDMQNISESLRVANKKIEQLERTIEDSNIKYTKLYDEFSSKEDAYKNNADLISFYKNQIQIASEFPNNKDDICDWIEEKFSDDIVISSRAKSEMKKYSGSLNVSEFCDAIVYLDAYARFRRNEISEEDLKLYSERNNWETTLCGRETIRVRKSDYIVNYNDKQYTLELHIKRGVKSGELTRIYFCWCDDLQKILIGSMPEHLATVKQNT